MNYQKFLEEKSIIDIPTGMPCEPSDVHGHLFDFQKLIVAWAVKRGRAAIFADCGLGKTLMQLEWARLVGDSCLIVAPLCVAQQTIREAKKIGLMVSYAKNQGEVFKEITITNYERIEGFDPSHFNAVVLDESSILKGIDGKIKSDLIERFSKVPFRLCCTATPAPNDIVEIANHAEFLGVMSRPEMLATFFVHDQQDWRLKGHAQEGFWKWLVSWAICLRSPEDIGCDGSNFKLPKIEYHRDAIETGIVEDGMLFGTDVVGLQSRIRARSKTVEHRVKHTAQIVNGHDQWLVWCGLNSESAMLTKEIPDAVEVKGSDSLEHKENSVMNFIDGKVRVLVTKPSITGFGLNFQNCQNMAFVGLSDSYEEFYQAVRRCWRFGQKKTVNVHIITATIEGPVVENIKRKEKESEKMHKEMIEHMRELETREVKAIKRESFDYQTRVVQEKEWTMNLGDTVELTAKMPDNSVDLSVCSPPFSTLYTYTNSERDMGNSKDDGQFFKHYGFFLKDWLRVTKPGRLACIHVAQVPAMLSRDGYIGLKDFRGNVIRAHIESGWIFHGEITIDKNPQAQAIRTKAKGLTFSQLERDSSWMRPALGDYLLLFRKDGENQAVVKPDVSREDWILWAHPCWYDIRETDTLTVAEARDEKDERHICPLQLGLIDRCVKLWSNRGETVFSPFAGIGSEGYQALLNHRRFIGNELKENYFRTACTNLQRAISRRSEGMLLKETT